MLLGDVGGTNIRLLLKQIDAKDSSFEGRVIKDGSQLSQKVKSFEEALSNFLNEFKNTEFWPQVAVLGVAGPVDNNTVEFTNVIKWSLIDGTSLSQILDIPHFVLINDFTAAGYGILPLKERDFIRLDDNQIIDGAVKVVIGPGTGLG